MSGRGLRGNTLNRVPDHGIRFGAQVSPVTDPPRLAANPPDAILTLFVFASRIRSAACHAAFGARSCLAFLHVETAHLDRLVCDLFEPVRHQVDEYLLDGNGASTEVGAQTASRGCGRMCGRWASRSPTELGCLSRPRVGISFC
jgi:hypothetical protein